MDKSPDAFRTISEVADELQLPQHVLRFWETKFNQIKPMKRGGGRRYYRPNEVELLRGIRHLLYTEGYTIKGVQKILREQGAGFVVNAMDDRGGEAVEDAETAPEIEAPAMTSEASNVSEKKRLSKKTIRNLKAILEGLKEARQLIDTGLSGD